MASARSERPYTVILDAIKFGSVFDFSDHHELFQRLKIYQLTAHLILEHSLDNWLPHELRGEAERRYKALGGIGEEPLIVGTQGWQTGVAMLVYAINQNDSINNIKIDLSFCHLTHEYEPLKSLSRLNKHIRSINLSGNNFIIGDFSCLFEHLWDHAYSRPTFDVIDCRFNRSPIPVANILELTKYHPGHSYVLCVIAGGQKLSTEALKYTGTFIISGDRTVTYYVQSGEVIRTISDGSFVESVASLPALPQAPVSAGSSSSSYVRDSDSAISSSSLLRPLSSQVFSREVSSVYPATLSFATRQFDSMTSAPFATASETSPLVGRQSKAGHSSGAGCGCVVS
jgi:hypothetical protein